MSDTLSKDTITAIHIALSNLEELDKQLVTQLAQIQSINDTLNSIVCKRRKP